MAGIYIHIPFCKSRCIYCGFYSTTNAELRQRYTEALVKEAQSRPTDTTIGTIYLGGGTPSQLSIGQMRLLFEALYNIYKVEDNAEVTLEVNPDDVTEQFASMLSTLPVNRVSMGTQTFDNQRLSFLHRRHNASQVPMAVKRLREAGIGNINVDLMYGFPDETLSQWQHDIDMALALNVEHISAYCLMIEENTPLHRMNIEADDEETERLMYYTLVDRLEAAGYDHYEISNFARPGRRSRHNSSYWTDVPYIGLGAAAHSYDGKRREWNVDNINAYISGIENGTRKTDGEQLSSNDRYNDRVMLSLRTREGISLSSLSEDDRSYLLPLARKHIDSGLLASEDGRLHLTRQGLFVSDMVMSDLMRI